MKQLLIGFLLLLPMVVPGCHRSVGSSLGDSGLNPEAGIEVRDGGSPPDGDVELPSVDCLEAADQIMETLSAGDSACSLVLRLSVTTLEPVGYQTFCGDATAVGPAEALAIARAEAPSATGWDLPFEYPPEPSADFYGFWWPPGDVGSSVLVSAVTARAVLGFVLVWTDLRYLVFPEMWQSGAPLQPACPMLADHQWLMTAVDLESMIREPPRPELQSTGAEVVSWLSQSPVSRAIQQYGRVLNGNIHYAHHDDPETYGRHGEWFILLNIVQ